MKVEEQTAKVLPVSMRENKPRIHTIRINRNRPDGLPDGVHCGVWLNLDDKTVWKCLYGRPFINSDVIVRTQEDKFLNEFADLPYFPRNWKVEQANHLWWLVRHEAYYFDAEDYKDIDDGTILEIEQTIYKVNSRGWSIGDYITLLIDQNDYHIFIADLSTACQDTQADDWDYIEKFFKLCKRERFVTLRNNARTILHDLHYNTLLFNKDGYALNDEQLKKVREFKHVYASFNRPISSIWASLGKVIYKHEAFANWENMIPWTWIITDEPLSDEKINNYELRWGWSSRK